MKKIFKNLFRKQGQNGDYYIQHRLRRGFAKVNIPDITDVKNRIDDLEQNTVKISGNQTINGDKTFNNTTLFTKIDNAITLKPATDKACFIEIKNNANNRCGVFGKGSSQDDNISIFADRGDIQFSVPNNKKIDFKDAQVECSKVPNANNSIANKKYVDDTNNLLQADINDVEQRVDTHQQEITTIKNTLNTNSTNIVNLEQKHNEQETKITNNTNAIAGIHVKNTEQDTKIQALETSQAAQDTQIGNLNNLAPNILSNTNRIIALEQKPAGNVVTAHFHTFSIKNDLGYDWVSTAGDGSNRGYTWVSRITLKPLPNGIQPTHNNVMSLVFAGADDTSRSYRWETATSILYTMYKNTRQTDDYRTIMDNLSIQITVLSGGNFRMVTSGLDFDEQKLYIGGND